MFKINAYQLRRALEELSQAEENGFMYCEAVFLPDKIDGIFTTLRYSDMHEKAHPTDGNFDWGRCQRVSRRHRFVNGELIPIE